MSGPGTLPRTKTIHFISTISAVRTTWGVDQAGEQQRLVLDKGQHIAHEVAAAGGKNLPVQMLRPPHSTSACRIVLISDSLIGHSSFRKGKLNCKFNGIVPQTGAKCKGFVEIFTKF